MKETKTSEVMERNKTHMAVKPSALNVMAQRLSMDAGGLLNTLKNTVFKGATNEQLAALVVVSNEHGLNPFTREVYAFPDKRGGIQAVVGVDGWLRIINSNPTFNGVEFVEKDGECTCILHVKGRDFPVKVTEYAAECERNTDPWKSHPRRMLRHKALIQAARIAFGYGGLKDEDDAWTVQSHPASDTILQVAAQAPEPEPAAQEPPADDDGDLAPVKPKLPGPTPQAQLEALLEKEGFTLDDFQKWGEGSGAVPDAGSYGTWEDVPADVAGRMLKAKVGLLHGLGTLRKGAK